MNRQRTRLAGVWILAACLLAFGISVLAQQPAHPDPVGESLFPPDLVMAHEKEIGLDQAQKSFLRSEILKTQSRFTELQWQLQDNMETLVGLLKQNTVDETQALAQLDKVLNSEREIKRAQITLMVRIKNKLTPEQQAHLRQLRPEPAPH